jgi:hypothetical protein
MARWLARNPSLASKRDSFSGTFDRPWPRFAAGLHTEDVMAVTDLNARLDTLSPEKRALVERSLKRRLEAARNSAPIPRRTESGPAPLSFSQQRMWFLDQWEPGSFTHNGARAFRLTGPIDAGALERALVRIVQRHEVLRTVYALQGREPRQQVLDDWELRLEVVDLREFADAERDDELGRLLRALSREPFDLRSDLMVRPTLFQLGANDHALLVRLHHIAFDAFSDKNFFGELDALYSGFTEGREATLEEPPIQYADYAVWQREHLSGPHLARLVEYWRNELSGAPPLLLLPIDGSRYSPQRHEGRHHEISLPAETARAVVEFGRSVGATPYMTLLAAFAVLLYRVSGQDEVVLGSPIANRGRPELDRLIGFFTNTLALRVRLNGNPSFREVVNRTRETALQAYAHQDLPFERIVEELQVERDPSYNPIFQVNFRAQAEERQPLKLRGVSAAPLAIDIGFSRFDLALELQLRDDGIGGYIEYDLDLFEQDTIVALAAELESMLGQLVSSPDKPILELRVQPRWRLAGTARRPSAIRRSRNS